MRSFLQAGAKEKDLLSQFLYEILGSEIALVAVVEVESRLSPKNFGSG